MLKLFKEYYTYMLDVLKRILNVEPIYLVIMIGGFVLLHIIISCLFYFVYKKTAGEKKKIVWIPFINILYVAGKEIHSLFSIVIIFEFLFIIPYPHRINGVAVISGIFLHKFSAYLYFIIILEVIFLVLLMLYKYLRHENSIRVIK